MDLDSNVGSAAPPPALFYFTLFFYFIYLFFSSMGLGKLRNVPVIKLLYFIVIPHRVLSKCLAQRKH